MLKLKRIDNGILSIKLNDILKFIDNIDNMKWKILWLEGISDGSIQMLDFENRINNSIDGYPISSSNLIMLSNSIMQFINLVLIGDQEENNLHRLENDEKIKEHCEFFIELVDSSYWEVSSKDEQFLYNM